METTTANSYKSTTQFNYVQNTYASQNTLSAKYNKFIEELKFSHFGLIAFAILVGSCLGSISAMYLFMAGAPIVVFGIGLFATMANLVACISQAPTKWVVNMFVLSIVVNLVLLAVSPLL